MKLGIDLHNIRDGGGINYVSNLLASFQPTRHGFAAVCLFGSAEVLAQMPDGPRIEKRPHPLLSRSLPFRVIYLFAILPKEIRRAGCAMLYSPGGLYFGRVRPFATISRNMMPFAKENWALYDAGIDRLRLHILRFLNAATFRRADRMIYLSRYAASTIGEAVGHARGLHAVIPHGINRERFRRPASPGLPHRIDPVGPIRLVYPSRLEPYKHQVEVVDAVARLRTRFPGMSLDLYGPANPSYGRAVQRRIAAVDPAGAFVRYRGSVSNSQLPEVYADKHLLIFASSCENLPNILLEAFQYGIPVACSSSPPMPEIGGDCCSYFDPRSSGSIEAAIAGALADWPTTLARAARAQERAQDYSWSRCADATFAFLRGALDSGTLPA